MAGLLWAVVLLLIVAWVMVKLVLGIAGLLFHRSYRSGRPATSFCAAVAFGLGGAMTDLVAKAAGAPADARLGPSAARGGGTVPRS